MTVLSSMKISRPLDSNDQYYQKGHENLMRGITNPLKVKKIKLPDAQLTLHLLESHASNNPDHIAMEL